MGTIKSNTAGFTLIELLLAVAISGIVVAGLMRFYLTGLTSYTFQEQMTAMHQNAQYTIKRLSEDFMQAGADLPDSGYPVITASAGVYNEVTLIMNKRSGM
jgi:prepilin-type N-terminal cleavage/methylation domain-containing protein